MAVTIGHASIDENRKAKGGSAGDQTKKEVCTRSWYSKPWTSVIRPKDSAKAEKIAKAMEQACANDKIGYDQYQRTTLYTQAKAVNWDLSKIATACECDCSSLVAVCVNAAGIKVSKDIYTGNEKTALANTGAFTVLTDSKYIGKPDYLKRGDILLGSGHTAVVLTDGADTKTETAVAKPVSITVKQWQIAAMADGFKFPKYGADGEWGAECASVARKAVVKKRIIYTHKNLTRLVQKAVGVTADGLCGKNTDAAIRAYQKKHGLNADGAVGLNTWKKILNID